MRAGDPLVRGELHVGGGFLPGPNPSANLAGSEKRGAEASAERLCHFVPENNPKKNARQRLQECWCGIQSLAGNSVSMIIRPSVFEVQAICKDYVTIKSSSGRLLEIPVDQVRAVLNHLFSTSKISLHQTRVRYSREHAEFIFGMLARLPGIRVIQCATGLILILEAIV